MMFELLLIVLLLLAAAFRYLISANARFGSVHVAMSEESATSERDGRFLAGLGRGFAATGWFLHRRHVSGFAPLSDRRAFFSRRYMHFKIELFLAAVTNV